MEIVKACMEIVWQCQLLGFLKFWAMENPMGLLRRFMGIPHYQFYQWQFGETLVKHTDIWGYFKDPTPMVKVKPDHIVAGIGQRAHGRAWSKPECPPEYEAYISQFKGDAKRAAIRAITPPGFAQAFYRANK